MAPTPDNIDWALGQISQLSSLPGFPKDEHGVLGLADAYCRMVRNETAEHSILGRVNDADWLIRTVLDTCRYSPSPGQLRSIFCRYFAPADGTEIDFPED